MQTDIDIIEKSYDDIPYYSKAHDLSLPENLYLACLVHGLEVADIKEATVLELGCADGVNILSFAANNPKASVIGIDLSEENIKKATRIAISLGLDNANFVKSDITNITSNLGKFDYVIVHGVYSWVNDDIKDAIFRVMDECLEEKGVGYVSFNTYPGWKVNEVMRDIMKFRVEGKECSVDEAVNLGFDAIAFIKNNAVDPLIKNLMETKYKSVINKNKNYIMHEYFEHYNNPNYLFDVVKQARRHNLNYLCDAEFSQSIFTPISSDIKDALLIESNGDRAKFEQYIDFIINRTFRRALFIRDEFSKQADYGINIKFKTLDKLFISGKFNYDDSKKTYVNTLNSAVMPMGMDEMFDKLNKAYPSNLSIKELMEDIQDKDQIYQNLAYLLCSMGARFWLSEKKFAETINKTPKLNEMSLRLAKYLKEVDKDASFFTSRYSNLTFDKHLDIHILPLINGKHTKDELVEEVIRLEKEKVFAFILEEKIVTDEEKIKELAVKKVDSLLNFLLQEGCLER